VGTDEARKDALARWSRLPKFIDTEIANLREGLKAGYSAPKGNVRIVIDQMNTLISTPTAESPFGSPSVRDKATEFATQFDLLVREQIVPGMPRFPRTGIPARGPRGDAGLGQSERRGLLRRERAVSQLGPEDRP
jgi:uncharacterized protein (DUF885 family)